MQLNSKAQSILEYFSTYSWILVLSAIVIVAIAFVVSSPISNVNFSSSDPSKITVKGGAVAGSDVSLTLQNIVGGKMAITKVWLPASYSGACFLNGESISTGVGISPGIKIMTGGEIYLKCNGVTDVSGRILIEYTDYADLLRLVTITAKGNA